MSVRPRFYTDVKFQYLLDDSSSSDMAVDGSDTPIPFYSFPGTTVPIGIMRVLFYIVDDQIAPSKFGGDSALSEETGLRIELVNSNDSVAVDFLGGFSIKNNADWTLLAGPDSMIHPAAGNDLLSIRWTIAGGLNGILQLRPGQRLKVTVRGDLTRLVTFRGFVQGCTI